MERSVWVVTRYSPDSGETGVLVFGSYEQAARFVIDTAEDEFDEMPNRQSLGAILDWLDGAGYPSYIDEHVVTFD